MDEDKVREILVKIFGYRYDLETVGKRDIAKAVSQLCILLPKLDKEKVIKAIDVFRINAGVHKGYINGDNNKLIADAILAQSEQEVEE